MIANKITDRIIDMITDMTSKLQMLITFAMVVRLRPTIYQNAQNSEENLDKGICSTIFFQKNTSKCLNFVFKDQTPTFFFKIFATFFFATISFFFFLSFFFSFLFFCFFSDVQLLEFVQ
ncbi:hypothetical protein AAZX31_04G134000 [Glycine max]